MLNLSSDMRKYLRTSSRTISAGNEMTPLWSCFCTLMTQTAPSMTRWKTQKQRAQIHIMSIVMLCNVHWTFRSVFASSFMNPCSYFHHSWHAWLGIVDQNWLKLALAKLALGQSISLKVVGMPTPVIITVRSKFPFICM